MTAERNPEHTRQVILEAAFDEVLQNGFQATSLDSILSKTDLTKGALYHHFPNKTALGYAIVDDLVSEQVASSWIRPLKSCDNPIDCIQGIIMGHMEQVTPEEMAVGCPLNNLTQEMSPIDEGFRVRINKIYTKWREALADALKKGQRNGFVKSDINAGKAAAFIVASIAGCAGTAKSTQCKKTFADATEGLMEYLGSLRL